MRKNINKLVAFAIGISVMSGSIVPAFAADENQTATSNVEQTTSNNTAGTTYRNIVSEQSQVNQKPILTLKEAIDAAINNSEVLALKAKKIKLEEDKLDIQEKVNDDGYAYDSQELAVKTAKEDKEFQEDQLTQTVTDKYIDLVTRGDDLEKLKKQIEIKTKQLNDSKLKESLGMLTTIDIKSAENDLQTQKNNEKLKEDQLKNSQDYFKVLTGIDLNKYSLEEDQEYEVFRINGSTDEYFDNIIDKYFRYDKRSNELLKDYVKDIKTDKPGDAPEKKDFSDDTDANGSVIKSASDKYNEALADYNKEITAYKTYLETRYNYNAAIVGLDEKKKSYKQILKDSYASLLDMENKINVMRNSISITNKQLSIAKLKYDMGLITKSEYDNQILTSMDSDSNLKSLIINYNSLKNKIQKPWLLGGGSSSASASASASTGA